MRHADALPGPCRGTRWPQPAALLAGGGGDYWLNTSAPWDSYRTNIGVGVGQLRRVGAEWDWHGMGTADTEALALLARDGYVDRTRP